MLYIGYLIILDGQNIRKISFGNFPFLSCQGWKTKAGKLHEQVVPQPPWEPPPPPPRPNTLIG